MTKIQEPSNLPALELLQPVSRHIWGLPIEEWQTRFFAKLGVDVGQRDPERETLFLATEWVLSTPLAKAFRDCTNTALIVEGKIVGVNAQSAVQREKIVHAIFHNDHDLVQSLGIDLKSPVQISDTYNKTLRKCETPFALSVKTNSLATIERALFDSSYKGITDFVTKYIWPRPAFHFTRICSTFRITPNIVTTASLLFVVLATYFFWTGQWVFGFIAAWSMAFLDTVDGKLARTTMTYSNWGNIYDHGIDLIHPPFWYWAWFVGLQVSFPNPPAWLGLCLWAILVGYIVDRIIEGLFISKFDFHIHMWEPIDSFVRIITARRNPNTFIFMVALAMTPFEPKAGFAGLALIAFWTWLCNLFHVVRLLQAYQKPAIVQPWMA